MKGSKMGAWLVAVMAIVAAAVPAWAVPVIDYSASVTAVQTELVSTITPLIPLLFGILAVMAAIGLVRSLVKRFVKG